MYYEFKDHKLKGIFKLTDNVGLITEDSSIKSGLIHILWNRSDQPVRFEIDNIPINLGSNQITTSTYLHQVNFAQQLPDLVVFSFNREFYCIQDHDHEVSCNGIIFFGTQDLPIITLDDGEKKSLDNLLQVFQEEFATKDNIQGEMLRMLLKRLIIKCTRLAKNQLITKELNNDKIEIIRKFNVLVDLNYKKLKQVSEYADLVNKSPKTLSNLFKTYGNKSPLKIIHDRIVLEARRLLTMTDKTAKEIAYDLGFDDVSSFSKMFKKITGCSPIDFKKSHIA